ncbi:MarR family winged helix-turn-helix transcriptional regulator [Ferrovibrio xuzhouensis]|uniref:MarR family winged helix-turn-helix transcriptional regulator n=1 Tax=Ferrovibrio xuzhouensis TaxID=1576914 RepID=A0ABV7VFI9_9PROT
MPRKSSRKSARKTADAVDLTFRQLDVEGCTSMRLQAAAKLAMQVYARHFADSGVTSPQFAALAFLYRDGGLSVGRLAELLDTDQTTVTRNLRLLDQRGLVRQEVSPEDRRRRIVQITADGRRIFRAALPHWQQAQAELARRLGSTQTAQLNRQLDGALDRLRDSQGG